MTTLEIMISFVDSPYLETHFQNAMTCAKLKHLTKGMTRDATHGNIGGVHLVFHNISPYHELASEKLVGSYIRPVRETLKKIYVYSYSKQDF